MFIGIINIPAFGKVKFLPAMINLRLCKFFVVSPNTKQFKKENIIIMIKSEIENITSGRFPFTKKVWYMRIIGSQLNMGF